MPIFEPVTPNQNLLINPDFRIAQEGTSFATMADDTYILDGFAYYKSGAMVHTGSQATDVPTAAQSGHLSTKSLLIDCTTVDSSIAAGDYCYVAQFIEGSRALPVLQNTFTLRFWHKHTKTGTYCVALKNSGSDRSYIAEYTQSTTDTWELAVITISASPSAGTWDYTNGIGLQVIWTLVAGSTYQTTADSWATGDYLATSSQVNACDSTSNNFRLSQVSVYPGSDDRGFFAPDEQLIACQRYYEKSYDVGTNPGTATTTGVIINSASSSSFLNVDTISFRTLKRAAPSVSIYNSTDGTIAECDIFTASGAPSSTVSCATFVDSESGFLFNGQTNMTAGDQIRFHFVADARLRG